MIIHNSHVTISLQSDNIEMSLGDNDMKAVLEKRYSMQNLRLAPVLKTGFSRTQGIASLTLKNELGTPKNVRPLGLAIICEEVKKE